MGSRIAACAADDARIFDVRPLVRDADFTALEHHVRHADTPVVLVDFTSDAGAAHAIIAAEALKIAVLVGSTGLGDDTLHRAHHAAQRIPVLVAPNTSIGVAVLRAAVDLAARHLAHRADVNLFEAHHATKKDSPSGTAKLLCTTVRNRGVNHPDERNIHVVRAGTIVGSHAVHFGLTGETLEFRHDCQDRDVFARGAIDAACWVAEQPPGLYTIDDVLGITPPE
ncbi:MAG: 4-hydroxy-tetrahydrodipicolinate reductase [Phycisphaerales bacterium]|nr:4-hydroxy-tetrahydrodipicolinate reductase [Phycisphaerales bacterium]